VFQLASAWPELGLDPWRYAGLGTVLIDEAFVHALPAQDVALKALFTSWSIGTGFKGGEVTPLFAIGASLGNALSVWMAPWLSVPLSFMAALGWVGVFAAATRTPLACTVMAMELFGWALAPHAALVCWLAHRMASRSGQAGIYAAQAEPWGPEGR
jgi:H+/Cl- antiporter ClcA